MDDERRRAMMTELAENFPCLQGTRGVNPFEPAELAHWATGPVSHGERVTASFLLIVWDSSTDWEAGRLDLMEALNVWSPSHRDPFLKWASDPWWP